MPKNNMMDRYLNTAKPAERLAQETLERIKTLQVAPNPIHYTLLYEYLGKIDPLVIEELGTSLQLHAYDDETAAEIFQNLLYRMISQQIPLDETDHLLTHFQEKTERWQTSLHEEQEALKQEIQQLSLNAHDAKSTTQLLENKILPHLQAIESNVQQLMEGVQQFIQQFERMRMRFSSEQTAARTDPLSGLLNRRGLMEKLQQIMLEAQQSQQTFSIIMIDIDYFKQINDQYGHIVGDSVIRYLARVLKNETKGQDVVARLGGEEFVVVLPHTPLDSAKHLADKLRQKVARKVLSVRIKNLPLKFTFSAGVAMYQLGESIESLFQRADKALYLAKEQGRNKVVGEDAL